MSTTVYVKRIKDHATAAVAADVHKDNTKIPLDDGAWATGRIASVLEFTKALADISDANPTDGTLATRDVTGRVPVAQLPIGYDGTPPTGTWAINNAGTVLNDGSGVAGTNYYVGSDGVASEGAGTLSLIDGITVAQGGKLYYNGSVWFYAPKTANFADGTTDEDSAAAKLDFYRKGAVDDRTLGKQTLNGLRLANNGDARQLTNFESGALKDKFSICFTFRAEEAPANEVYLMMLTGSSAEASGSNGGVTLQTDGTIDSEYYDGAFRSADDLLGGAITYGQNYRVAYVVNSDGTGLEVFINGVSKGTVSTSEGASDTLRLCFGNSNRDGKGIEITNIKVFSKVLTAAQIADDFKNPGRVDLQDQFTTKWIRNFDGITSTVGFGVSGGTLAANIDAIGGRNDNLRTTDSGASSSTARFISLSSALTSGRNNRIKVSVYIPAASTEYDRVWLGDTNGFYTYQSSDLAKDTWHDIYVDSHFAGNTTLAVRFMTSAAANPGSGASGQVAYVRAIQTKQTGCQHFFPGHLANRGVLEDAQPGHPVPLVFEGGASTIRPVEDHENRLITAAIQPPHGVLEYDGVNDYTQIGDQVKLEVSTGRSFAVSAWLLAKPGAAANMTIATKRASGAVGYISRIEPGGILGAYIQDDSPGSASAKADGPNLESIPVLVLTVYDRTKGELRRYVNSSKIYGSVADISARTGNVANTSATFEIGRNTGGGDPFHGLIGDVQFWNCAPSGAAIEEFMRTGQVPNAYRTNASTLFTQDSTPSGEFTAVGGAHVDAAGPVGGKSNVLEFTPSNVTGQKRSTLAPGFLQGKRYRVHGFVRVASGNSDLTGLRITQGTSSVLQVWGESFDADTWQEFTAEFDATGGAGSPNLLEFRWQEGSSDSVSDSGGDDKAYLAEVTVEDIGLALDAQVHGSRVLDASQSGYDGTVSAAAANRQISRAVVSPKTSSSDVVDSVKVGPSQTEVHSRRADGRTTGVQAIQVAPGFGYSQLANQTLADDAGVALEDVFLGGNPYGFITITNASGAASGTCIIAFRGTASAPAIVSDPFSHCSTVAGTDGKLNFYLDAGNSNKPTMENKLGLSCNFTLRGDLHYLA